MLGIKPQRVFKTNYEKLWSESTILREKLVQIPMGQWPHSNKGQVFTDLSNFERNGELDFHVYIHWQQIPLKYM